MEISYPDDIEVAANLDVLLQDIAQELDDFRSLGELPPEIRAELHRSFLPERISDTLTIEGIRVNPRITRAILDGLALAESDKYTEREVLNVIAADELIESEARSGMPLTLDLIRELHRRVEDDLIPSAGTVREDDVKITGAGSPPPNWADVPALVSEMCIRYESARDVHAVVRAAWLHGTFTRIHPFMDGNGRTGRLLQDFALLSAELFPVGIPVARRGEYYDALESADTGDWRPLIEVIANSELTALDRARRIAEAPSLRRARVQELLRAAQATVRQNEYNRYEVWRRRVDGVRDEFARWVEDFNAEAEDLKVRVRTYDTISFETWSEMRVRGRGVRNTWILTLTFAVGRRPVYTFLLYARRHEFDYTHDTEQLERGLVGLFLTGANEPDSRYDFGRYSDPFVALRELLYTDAKLLVYRDPSVRENSEDLPEGVQTSLESGRWHCVDSSTLADVVEEFFTDALCKLGLID